MKTYRFILFFFILTALSIAQGIAQKLPNIHILATGGTIAGTGSSATGTAYTAGQVAIADLIDAVPELKKSLTLRENRLSRSVPRICPMKYG